MEQQTNKSACSVLIISGKKTARICQQCGAEEQSRRGVGGGGVDRAVSAWRPIAGLRTHNTPNDQ